MKSLLIATIVLAIAGPLYAERADLWLPSECDPSSTPAYERAAKRQRALSPADPAYLPHPFPSRDDEVLANFIYRHRRAYSDTPILPPEEKRFFESLEANALRHDIQKVADWTPARCGRYRMVEFYFLIRLFDRQTGEEITRAALDNTGHVAAVVHAEPGNPIRELRDLEQAGTLAAAALKAPVKMTQYIATSGTLRCDVLWPCVAMKSSRSIILAYKNQVWRVETDRPAESVRANMGTLAARKDFLRRLHDRTDKMITLGGDSLAHITQVGN